MLPKYQRQIENAISSRYKNSPSTNKTTDLKSKVSNVAKGLTDISNEERKDKVPPNLKNRSITANGKIYRRREADNEQFQAKKQVRLPLPQTAKIEEEGTLPICNESKSNSDQSLSQQPIQTQMQVQTFDDSSEISEFFQEEEQLVNQNGSDLDIQQFILEHHIGVCEYYRLPKINLRIYDSFYDKNRYEYVMSELVKHEIIADVNRRIQEKKEERYQGQIRVQLSSQLIWDHKAQQYIKIVMLKAKGRDYYFIEEALIKGKRLGLITRSQRFHTRDLISKQNSTYLCFIWKDRKTKNIMVRGLDELEIPRPPQQDKYSDRYNYNEESHPPLQRHQYYFMDLDSIISSIRQYNAVRNIYDSPLIKTIINNTPVKPYEKYDKERKRVIKGSNIFQKIKKLRNNSQIDAIKTIFEKECGLFLIQGPPGTGKTQSIANFASIEQNYFKKSELKSCDKLMICAQANAAVNHIGRKLLKDGMIGRNDMPNILRLGHTEEFDNQLLSINLPHLCQIKVRDTKDNSDDWSAKLRWQKVLLREKINRLMEDSPMQREEIRQARYQLFKKVRRLVEINEELEGKKAEFEIIETQLLEESEIVLSTLNTSGKKRFATFYHNRIRCLLIDEASQATEPSTLIPFGTQVQKVILVGDHMQLQPTVMSNNCFFTHYNRSLFERLAIKNPPLLLDTQYRMVQALMDFPNQEFYGGRLICGRDMKKYPVPYSLKALKSSSMFFDVAYGIEEVMKKSYINEAEAICVSILIKRLVYYAPQLSIGVIAPYKGQVKLIQSKVYKEVVDNRDRLRISTVDAFQGQERDVIIISTVRNNPERNIGFVRDEKRLNVAITRSKNALFVFGSANTLSSNSTWAEYLNYHRLKGSLHSLPQDQEKCDTAIRLKIELQKA